MLWGPSKSSVAVVKPRLPWSQRIAHTPNPVLFKLPSPCLTSHRINVIGMYLARYRFATCSGHLEETSPKQRPGRQRKAWSFANSSSFGMFYVSGCHRHASLNAPSTDIFLQGWPVNSSIGHIPKPNVSPVNLAKPGPFQFLARTRAH